MTDLPQGSLSFSDLRPKPWLKLRMMFERGYRFQVVAGAILLLIAAALGLKIVNTFQLERCYRTEGIVATATVEQKSTQYVSSRVAYFDIHYSFTTTDGQSIRASEDVSKERWDALNEGDPIEIEYLPGEPSSNRLLGVKGDETVRGRAVWPYLLIPVPVAAVAVLLLGEVARRTSKHCLLLGRGVLGRGMIDEKEEHKELKTRDGFPFIVRFHFDLPGGRTQTAEELISDLDFADSLTPGEPAGVIYLPGRPARCAIFREDWLRFFETTPAGDADGLS